MANKPIGAVIQVFSLDAEKGTGTRDTIELGAEWAAQLIEGIRNGRFTTSLTGSLPWDSLDVNDRNRHLVEESPYKAMEQAKAQAEGKEVQA